MEISKKRRRGILTLALCLAGVLALLFLYIRPPLRLVAVMYPYPSSWNSIEIGDTPQAVAQKCPDIDQSLQKIKGDFAHSDHRAGTWILEVLYTPNRTRVTSTSLVLRLGSKTHHRPIHYKLQ